MIKYIPEDVTLCFSEVPGEVSLGISISGCGGSCEGCHSTYLRDPSNGEELSPKILKSLLDKYKDKVSCICFLGGYQNPDIINLLELIKYNYGFRVAMYCGCDNIDDIDANVLELLNYVKIGSYKKELGGLESKTTNQRLYKIVDDNYIDLTEVFWRFR
jgi:anaerobic ribonucleoside-triphosphate reductase activating protein